MKRFALLFVLGIAVTALASEPIVVTVTQLNAKPLDYHGKEVETTGKVVKFQNKTSRAGNAYFTFNLTEPGKGREVMSVNIYGMGHVDPELKEGQTVTVTGEFKKEKVVSGRTYKMEIQVKPKDVVPVKQSE